MAKHKDLITLNGKVFDVKVGTLAHSAVMPKNPSHVSHPHLAVPAHKASDSAEHRVEVKIKTLPKRQSNSSHNIHNRRERAKTLARTSVKKPGVARPIAISGSVFAEEHPQLEDYSLISIKEHHKKQRTERAKNISKNPHIKRFGYIEPTEVFEPVVTMRAEQITLRQEPAKTPPTPKITGRDASASDKLFASALKNANSHSEKLPKSHHKKHRVAKKLRLKPKTANALAGIMVFFGLAGFIAYQNMANISVRMAAARSGVHASLPSYRPAGFSINNNVDSQPGRVVISFKSNSDAREFEISQIVSEWNSQTLLDSYVAVSGQPFEQINQEDGKTVYLYGNSSATWVENGVWYNVEGQAGLNSSQLLKLAGSF